jgi:hypothetical protein
MKEIVATILQLDRTGRNSLNGNPRYKVTLDNGDIYLTAPAASIAYVISNREFQDLPVRFRIESGQIAWATPEEEA